MLEFSGFRFVSFRFVFFFSRRPGTGPGCGDLLRAIARGIYGGRSARASDVSVSCPSPKGGVFNVGLLRDGTL